MRGYSSFARNVLLALLLMSSLAYAETTSSGTSTGSQSIIKLLQEQIKMLTAQVDQLKAQLESTNRDVAAIQTELKLNRFLQRGVTGEDVKQLQTFLSQFPDIYPEGLVTGYYGPKTEAAVRKLQEQNGIESIGAVGPKTLTKINTLIAEGRAIRDARSASTSLSETPGTTVSTALQQTGASTTSTTAATSTAVVTTTQSATSSATTSTTTQQQTPATPSNNSSGSAASTNAGSNTSSGTTSTTSATSTASSATTTATSTTTTPTPDTTPPVISNIQATNITISSATITWVTNELADSKLYFSVATTTPVLADLNYVTAHSLGFLNLSAGSIYKYVVVSKDSSGNTATSSEQSFTTTTLASPPPPPPNTAVVGKIIDDAAWSVQKIQVIGNYAFLATFGVGSSGSGLGVIDISNPANPTVAAFLKTSELLGVHDMAIVGNYAYLTGDSKGLVVVDISNPHNPVLVSSATYSGQACPNGIFVQGQYAFVVDRCSNRFTAFNVANPINPIVGLSIQSSSDFVQAEAIYVANGYAYVGGSSSGKITVINVSNPTDASVFNIVGYVGVGDVQEPRSIQIVGDYLYVADTGNDGLFIERLDSATNSTLVGRLGGMDATRLYVLGSKAYVVSYPASYPTQPYGIMVVDVSVPSNPSLLQTITYSNGSLPFRVFADNTYIYTSFGKEFDIISPTVSGAISSAHSTNNLAAVSEALNSLSVLLQKIQQLFTRWSM